LLATRQSAPETFGGRVQIVNRLVDAMVLRWYGIYNHEDLLKVEMVSLRYRSSWPCGSVGTLAIGLASKDIASSLLNGLMLSASDRIYEGDSVQFGTVWNHYQVGLVRDYLRDGVEIMVVFNGGILQRPVSNLRWYYDFGRIKQMPL
jgi:hypothetical protein